MPKVDESRTRAEGAVDSGGVGEGAGGAGGGGEGVAETETGTSAEHGEGGGRGAARGRRRGSELEAVILEAAWAELAETGYAHLTMEGVAARAHTGKQVLYRRWRNRVDLVVAAMRHATGSLADRVPDTGSLRGDVLEVLGHMTARQREIGPDVLYGLLADVPDLAPDPMAVMDGVMAQVLAHAAARGEIDTADLHPRAASAASDLLRHEMLLTREPVPDSVLIEIVDEVFLPLVHALARRD